MNSLKKLIAVAGLSLGAATAAQAQVVFFDDFDSYTTGLNKSSFGPWTVVGGNVDLLPANGINFGVTTEGNFVDLVGNDPGELTRAVNLTGGQLYKATFQIGGARTGANSDTVTFELGTTSFSKTFATSDPKQTVEIFFLAGSTGSFDVSLTNSSEDFLNGAKLYSVQVAAVPEPRTVALMLAGLGVVGAVARRRQTRA